MPPKKPPPLNERERAFLEEAVDGFWKATLKTYRATTDPLFQKSPHDMSLWRTAYVAEMTSIMTACMNELTAMTNAQGN